jgi:hypothetical protein
MSQVVQETLISGSGAGAARAMVILSRSWRKDIFLNYTTYYWAARALPVENTASKLALAFLSDIGVMSSYSQITDVMPRRSYGWRPSYLSEVRASLLIEHGFERLPKRAFNPR